MLDLFIVARASRKSLAEPGWLTSASQRGQQRTACTTDPKAGTIFPIRCTPLPTAEPELYAAAHSII